MPKDIARRRARLCFMHLSAHLGTPELLTEAQIARFDALRGCCSRHYRADYKGP